MELQSIKNRFEKIFNTPFTDYWDDILGFDIVGFDDKFIKSGEKKMEPVIIEFYGQEGVTVLKDAIQFVTGSTLYERYIYRNKQLAKKYQIFSWIVNGIVYNTVVTESEYEKEH